MNKKLLAKLEEYNYLGPPYGEYALVQSADFFDGNNCKGSFAANASTAQYDVEQFRSAFQILEKHRRVAQVLINLYSFDEGEEWPYADTAFVVTDLPLEFFNDLFGEAFPSEISEVEETDPFGEIPNGYRVLCLWWD